MKKMILSCVLIFMVIIGAKAQEYDTSAQKIGDVWEITVTEKPIAIGKLKNLPEFFTEENVLELYKTRQTETRMATGIMLSLFTPSFANEIMEYRIEKGRLISKSKGVEHYKIDILGEMVTIYFFFIVFPLLSIALCALNPWTNIMRFFKGSIFLIIAFLCNLLLPYLWTEVFTLILGIVPIGFSAFVLGKYGRGVGFFAFVCFLFPIIAVQMSVKKINELGLGNEYLKPLIYYVLFITITCILFLLIRYLIDEIKARKNARETSFA